MHWVFKIEVASVRRACNSTWDCATNVASFAQRFEPFITWWFSQIKTTCWLLKAFIHFLQPGSSVGRHIPRKNLVRWAIAVIKVDSCTSLRFLKMEFLLRIGHWVWDNCFRHLSLLNASVELVHDQFKCRATSLPMASLRVGEVIWFRASSLRGSSVGLVGWARPFPTFQMVNWRIQQMLQLSEAILYINYFDQDLRQSCQEKGCRSQVDFQVESVLQGHMVTNPQGTVVPNQEELRYLLLLLLQEELLHQSFGRQKHYVHRPSQNRTLLYDWFYDLILEWPRFLLAISSSMSNWNG